MAWALARMQAVFVMLPVAALVVAAVSRVAVGGIDVGVGAVRAVGGVDGDVGGGGDELVLAVMAAAFLAVVAVLAGAHAGGYGRGVGDDDGCGDGSDGWRHRGRRHCRWRCGDAVLHDLHLHNLAGKSQSCKIDR
ncbi:hypothetical protein Vafri_14260 [Volvox africanus]|uniref:Uncharacterized protein n=1 Tax=Volvox africanus TaxID=51714 RepID=A0A8J4F4H8_9CHLO|nr:hypothetical protein Vafri_14260 [Volvox africanus]